MNEYVGTLNLPKRIETARTKEPLSGAYFWLLAFFVVYCARPEDWVPGLRPVPLAKITGAFAVLALLMSLGQPRARLPRELIYMFVLLGHYTLTMPFAAWPGGSFKVIENFAKLVVIMVVMVLAVSTVTRLRRLLFVQAGSVVVIAIATLIKGRSLPSGRLQGVLGGIYSNPNDLAFAIVLSMPLCFAFFLKTSSIPRKAFWIVGMLLMTYALMRTASRAGLLALIIAMGVCLWKFGVKGHRDHLVLAGIVLGFAFLVVAGGRLADRFRVMLQPRAEMSTKEELSAEASVEQRWKLLGQSIRMTFEHPLMGVGPGNFGVIAGDWQVAHNSYTEISSEGGFPALILYLLILWQGLSNLSKARKHIDARTEQGLYIDAVQANYWAFLVGSFFASVGYSYFVYFMVGYTTALLRIGLAQQSTPADLPSPASGRRSPWEVFYGKRFGPQTATNAR